MATIPLHTREEIETPDDTILMTRYRVAGGWLYHAHPCDSRKGPYAALCFVPDAPTYTEQNGPRSLYENIFGRTA